MEAWPDVEKINAANARDVASYGHPEPWVQLPAAIAENVERNARVWREDTYGHAESLDSRAPDATTESVSPLGPGERTHAAAMRKGFQGPGPAIGPCPSLADGVPSERIPVDAGV